MKLISYKRNSERKGNVSKEDNEQSLVNKESGNVNLSIKNKDNSNPSFTSRKKKVQINKQYSDLRGINQEDSDFSDSDYKNSIHNNYALKSKGSSIQTELEKKASKIEKKRQTFLSKENYFEEADVKQRKKVSEKKISNKILNTEEALPLEEDIESNLKYLQTEIDQAMGKNQRKIDIYNN
eukprot:CAMPEP_0170523544 /NCGR_PEP_ID=MMETSP0209-20121228/8947_1 /TAXON_ID=665100 ORGANISM="Litonotus pictus, Strain P1" /NCGR_SAMPLE_ID=MMETSP0209 /ASSEMBLY_ACC=CAM_ASM_000301 /LENGTH=180 /DNA_ID=CAMNT_0010811665 /DNA_START=18 /DNA_END=557 /DNA_ORIENTATION=-